MFEKIIYECEYCGNQYKTLPQVEACERKCISFQKEKEIDKILPKYHKDDTRYLYHCVDCGTRLIEYEYSFDGINVEYGKVIFETERAKAFQGLRCIDCHRKLRDVLVDALTKKGE